MTAETNGRGDRWWRCDDKHLVDRLVALAEEGMASGIDYDFDIDAFVDETRLGIERQLDRSIESLTDSAPDTA